MRISEQILGMMMGAVAGDSLGTPHVFTRSEKMFDQASRICWEISDPGICTRMISAGMLAVSKHGMNADEMVKSYCKWANSGQELDCVTAMCFGGKFKNADSLRAFAATLDHGALCSDLLLIRQIPIAAIGVAWDQETLFRHVELDCRLTHDDQESIEYAKLYACCLQGILQGKSRMEIWDRLFACVNDGAVYKTLLNSYYDRPCCDNAQYSHARTAFSVAMYHFWHDTPFVSSLRSTILSGGATDVNAAAAGALCGAFHGRSVIPLAWCDTLYDDCCDLGRISIQLAGMSRKIAQRSGLVRARTTRHVRTTERRSPVQMKRNSDRADDVSAI